MVVTLCLPLYGTDSVSADRSRSSWSDQSHCDGVFQENVRSPDSAFCPYSWTAPSFANSSAPRSRNPFFHSPTRTKVDPILLSDLPGRFLARQRLHHHLELQLQRIPLLGHRFALPLAQPWPQHTSRSDKVNSKLHAYPTLGGHNLVLSLFVSCARVRKSQDYRPATVGLRLLVLADGLIEAGPGWTLGLCSDRPGPLEPA